MPAGAEPDHTTQGAPSTIEIVLGLFCAFLSGCVVGATLAYGIQKGMVDLPW